MSSLVCSNFHGCLSADKYKECSLITCARLNSYLFLDILLSGNREYGESRK